MDFLAEIADHPTIAPMLADATTAIQAVHRRPVSLRRSEVTGAESVVQGAKLASLLGNFSLPQTIDAYSILAPNGRDQITRAFLRAPLQLLAKIDVLAGGAGRPASPEAARRLVGLAQLVTSGIDARLLPGVVAGEIIHYQLFGQRSMIVGLVAMRLALISGGFDPAGLTVPEVYLGRRQAEWEAAVADYGQQPVVFFRCYLAALLLGAAQAERIAAAATSS